MRKSIILACLIILIGAISSAQDVTIWFGNPDGSTMVCRVNSDIEVPVWVQTNSDVYIAALHIPLSSNDAFITKREGGELYEPFKNDYPPQGYDPGWDVADIHDPVPHQGKPGYTSQGLIGFMNLAAGPNVPLHCPSKCKIMEFEMRTAGDDSLKGHTYDVFTEGYDERSLGLNMSDTLGTRSFKCDARFSRIHFLFPGDVNGDFKITEADLSALEEHLDNGKEIPWPKERADCNDDGKVNEKDYKYLDKYLHDNGKAPK